ncbi:MAG: excinuclease ABC subunit UvrA, partial [Deltaproteobacteria bacterium]|nr:excinuclease ABC subunit UvrA [Deltaproteobacteria bacterium]
MVIRGAREHNLRGVDVELPRGALVVITGVSGSGKSSLAFDTIYQEGQRRFVESLSSYARQFLGAMERPKVDSIEGISPTLSIDQKTVNRNPRSTVGTVTEVLDHLRLLYARLGTPRCPECATEVSRLGLDQVVDRLIASAQGQRALVLGPVIRERKGEYRKELESLRLTGWTKARIDGVLCELDAAPALARYEKHTIEVVVDRLRIDLADRGRLAEACETAARLGGGTLVLSFPDGDRPDVAYSTARACPNHPEVSIPELEPRLFSFNAPQGACAACNGMGGLEAFDPDLLIDRTRPGGDACMAFSDGKIPFASFDCATWSRVLVSLGIDPKAPAGAWTPRQREQVLRGAPGVRYVYTVERSGRSEDRVRPWRGLVPLLDEVFTWAAGLATLQRLRRRSECPDCHGARLNPIAREVVFRGRRIWELTGLPVGEAAGWFAGLALTGSEVAVGAQIVQEIRGRLDFLREVGLDYLTLDRRSASLSGGEAQRIRLAAQVGSALQGVTYVLDEPSIGLHARDNRRLLGALGALRDRGNTVIVVEHDAETIQSADWLVDVGPGAGRNGGLILASGPPGHVIGASAGPTGRWLRGEVAIAHEPQRTPSGWLTVRGARANNLTGIDVRFPLGVLCVVTGVSGSGKSSLVFESLMDGVESALARRSPTACDAVEGVGAIDKLIELSQTPIGRTPRSNPATYVGAFDLIRDLFAATPESKARAYKKGRFSFNVAGGRCEACEGAGHKTVELQFLPSVEVPCEVCNGKRFNAETLEITWKGRTISDVLAMTIDEAIEVFGAIPKLARILGAMREVGLGYLPLGQPSTTVSGGEAQRLKIATELQRPPTGRTLYLLDEPTTGLHFDDVTRLVAALRRLVAAGNSVIVVEHHTDVIRVADHLVDLGPEGGAGGGRVVGEGRPEQLAGLDTPTGR